MKLVLATTALVAAVAFSPAFAQDARQQAGPPSSGNGEVTVEGIAPSRVLGAIDTEKLVTPQQGATEEGAPLSIPQTTTSVTTIEAPAETAKPMVNIASVNVPLPQEVAKVASNGKYTTKDLVQAQLTAMNNAPPVEQPVITTTTITYPNDATSPDAPASGGEGDQARTAATTGHSGDLTTPPAAAPGR